MKDCFLTQVLLSAVLDAWKDGRLVESLAGHLRASTIGQPLESTLSTNLTQVLLVNEEEVIREKSPLGQTKEKG